MGFDLYDFNEEHLIYRRTVIVLPHEAIVHRPRARLCCDLVKQTVYTQPTRGYIYANTNRIDAFKADVVAYINRNWADRQSRQNLPNIIEAINKSLLCCVEFSHDPEKCDDEQWRKLYDGRDRLYLNDQEKLNYHSSTTITCISLDALLKEDQYSDADVRELLDGVFKVDGSISFSGKFTRTDWLQYLILRPTMFGIGVDLNKAIQTLGTRLGR